VELGEQKRKFQSRGQSATHVPASTHHRVLSLALVDQVEIICKVLSCSIQPSSPNISANKHHMFQIIIEIAQVHQLLTPKNGTGKRLTCGPSLVMKYHSARKNLLRGFGKGRLRSAMRCRSEDCLRF
jgi:hypothetical protein